MSEEELMEFVLMVKDRGNYYFNRKEYEKAIFVYRRATKIVEEPPEKEDLRKLFSALHSNLAVCYSKVRLLFLILTISFDLEKLSLSSSATQRKYCAVPTRVSVYTLAIPRRFTTVP